MSVEGPEQLAVQPVGIEAVLHRMLQVEERLDVLSGELSANQREYETPQDSYRVHLAEHEQPRTKLSHLQVSPGGSAA